MCCPSTIPILEMTSLIYILQGYTTDADHRASYLDLSYGRYRRLQVKLYDKRDDFNFNIVNFQFLSSNIPHSPACGVYVSQLVLYARASSAYSDFH